MRKEGITVFALVITIVVALILISASIAGISNVVANSRITKFAEEILAVEDKLRLYYVENNTPYEEGTTIYSKEEILNQIDSSLREEFIIELAYNNDDNSVGFFIINNELLGIDRQIEDGIYIAAIPSLNVYSKNGISAKGKKFFSISSKINGSKNLRENEISVDLSTSQTQIVESLKVTKATNEWTNKLGITIDTIVNEGEKIYISFNQKEVLLKTNPLVNNTIYFDSLISENKNGIVVDSASESTFDLNDIQKFNSLSLNEKYIEIIKKDSSQNILAKVKVSLANVDLESPKMDEASVDVVSLNNDKNHVTFDASDNYSGIKEIRYEYYSTKDRMDGGYGETKYFSSGNAITQIYLSYNGKVAQRDESGKIAFDIPKEVTKIKLIIIDNALNESSIYYINTAVSNEVYYSISYISNDALNIAFYGDNSINGTMEYGSTENRIYGKYDFTDKSIITLNNIETVENKIYIRVKTNNSITRVINLIVPYTTNNGVKSKEDSRYYNPYIPNGFEHTVGNIDTGFVISDTTTQNTRYNEFVWVPVDNNSVKFERYNFGVGSIATFKNSLITNEELFKETNSLDSQIEESVKKYGGFYVSRYEISIDNITLVPKSVKNKVPWSGGGSKAIELANSMYDLSDCKSTLITAKAYDTLMNWLALGKYNVVEKTDNNIKMGNFSGSRKNTGSNENYVTNNIYDLAGNVAEFTTEKYDGQAVFRGGYYGSKDIYLLLASRSTKQTEPNSVIGCRAILYIK